MITQSMINAFVADAGPSFTWKDGDPSSRPHTDIRTGLKAYLYRYSEGLCVFCARPVDERDAQACHIVSSGGPKVRRGYVAGNIATGCQTCNDRQAEAGWDVVPLSAIARPDLVPDAWPRMPDLRRDGVAIKAARSTRVA